jgi:hypothetical protein
MLARTPRFTRREQEFAAKFLAASVAGFATDAGLLHFALEAGATPAVARIISLICALQIGFFVNVALVRKAGDGSPSLPQWARYMASQSLGNFCNYAIFVWLVSMHWHAFSNHAVALTIGAVSGWFVNYAGARFAVFHRHIERA